MSYYRNQNRRGNRRYRNPFPWELFEKFKKNPSWDLYFSLKKKIYRKGILNNYAESLFSKYSDDPLRQCLYLEKENRSIDYISRNRGFREFCEVAMMIAWDLPERPDFELVKHFIRSDKVVVSDKLLTAKHHILRNEPPPSLSKDDLNTFLLWMRVKFREDENIIRFVDDISTSMKDPSFSEESIPWEKLTEIKSKTDPEPDTTMNVSMLLADWMGSLQNSLKDFITLIQEQTDQLNQRDSYIAFLQQQQDVSEKIHKENQAKIEVDVKRMMMEKLADPMDILGYYISTRDQEDELKSIYKSFEYTLAEMNIFPVGRYGDCFEVSKDNLVRTVDNASVIGCRVKQVGLGWELKYPDGRKWPLVYPKVQRLDTEDNPSPDKEV